MGADVSFLILVVLASLVLYVRGLGFYSDDWAFLASLAGSPDQSVGGLFAALQSGNQLEARPLYTLVLVGLYSLFRLQPIGFHAFNAAVLIAAVVLLYLILLQLSLPRSVAIAAALVFALLPSYSTDRFWVAANHIPVSLSLCLFSLYAQLRAVAAPPRAIARFWLWLALGMLSLIASGLAYEVALPLFLLSPVLFWYRRTYACKGALGLEHAGKLRELPLLAGNAISFLALLAFKLATTDRARVSGGYLAEFMKVAAGSIRLNAGTYGLGLPYAAWWLGRSYPNWTIVVLALAVAAAIFMYLWMVAGRETGVSTIEASWPAMLVGGALTFGLGYAVFLVTSDIDFTPTGDGNRIAMPAAVGVAVAVVGGLAGAAGPASQRARLPILAMLTSLVCLCGFIVNNTLAVFWTAAYPREQAVVATIQSQVAVIAPGSTLILDGICPYNGPAVIFESSWDLAGALRLAYGQPALHADVVSRALQVTAAGLSTAVYGVSQTYPYGPGLFVFDALRRAVVPLPDQTAARQYFDSRPPGAACPLGQAGYGVRVLPPALAPYG